MGKDKDLRGVPGASRALGLRGLHDAVPTMAELAEIEAKHEAEAKHKTTKRAESSEGARGWKGREGKD